nr:hypothetical protein CFP56_12155 [Quercus suber]
MLTLLATLKQTSQADLDLLDFAAPRIWHASPPLLWECDDLYAAETDLLSLQETRRLHQLCPHTYRFTKRQYPAQSQRHQHGLCVPGRHTYLIVLDKQCHNLWIVAGTGVTCRGTRTK